MKALEHVKAWYGDASVSHTRVARSYLRALGVVYLVAFLSFGWQLPSLAGPQGILPFGHTLERLREAWGPAAYLYFPNLFWLGSSASWLTTACLAGAALGVALIAGVRGRYWLFAVWYLFFSVSSSADVFGGYQWESLLLEAGFLAILSSGGNRLGMILQRWLIFRLLFSSGIVKLLSQDPTWWNLTAVEYHLFTQPLPTPAAWLLHNLHSTVLKGLTFLVLFGEIVVPWLFLFPRRWRKVGAWFQIALQIVILFTGNFAYFNWLTLALCLWLFDDRDLPKNVLDSSPVEVRKWEWVYAAIVLWFTFFPDYRVPIAGRYGLFARMTTTHTMLEIQGSLDEKEWRPYRFRHVAPAWIAPHQPRLEWQAWFAGLSSFDREPWLQRLCIKLIKNEPAVLKLFADNPFREAPPRYLRIQQYEVEFTDWDERSHGWWRKGKPTAYSPVLTAQLFESLGL